VQSERLGLDRVEQFDPKPSASHESDAGRVLCDALTTFFISADVDDTSGPATRAPDGMSPKDRPEALGRLLGQLHLDCDVAAASGAGDEVRRCVVFLNPLRSRELISQDHSSVSSSSRAPSSSWPRSFSHAAIHATAQ
jgi:hypothetical protein